MMDLQLQDEQGRLSALHRYEILDTPPEAPFERITGLVRAVLNVPISTLTLIDADRQFYKSCTGMEGSDIFREFSFCTHTIQSREPMAIPDTLLDPRFAQYPSVTGKPFIRSYLGVPLATPDGYNIGSLCALDIQPRHFEAAQIEILKSFSALATDELELRRIAQIDSLTNAATRRSFLFELEKSIAKFSRRKQPAVLLTLDIDHFKRINDTFGHPTGDAVLRNVSRTLQDRLRKEDFLGRLGGEEFGILLADTGLDEAVKMGERLRRALQDHQSGVTGALQITASFGISALGDGTITSDLWLADADEALYAAKRSGRNKCCVAGPAVLLSEQFHPTLIC